MSTLHEELGSAKDNEDKDEETPRENLKEPKNISGVEAPVTDTKSNPQKLSSSDTFECLPELPAKTGTPSLVSSGYGSQAASSSNLSSEDSISVKVTVIHLLMVGYLMHILLGILKTTNSMC